MDIHKPKAAHSLREFAVEIGTIICGILIALGLEQAVEWSHQQTEVAETREALRDEVSVDMRAAQYHMADDACLESYFDGWMAWARGAPKPADEGHGAFPEFPTEAWAAAKSGAVAHMPLAERLAFTRFYSAVGVLDRLKDDQAENLMDFNGYRVFDRPLPEQGRQVLVILAKNKALAAYKQDYAAKVLALGRGLGVAPKPFDADLRASLQAICGGFGMRRAHADGPGS